LTGMFMIAFRSGFALAGGFFFLVALSVPSAYAQQHSHEPEPEEHSADEHKKHSPAPISQKDLEGDTDDHAAMGHGAPALFGPYPVSRESSGTSWQPDASAHPGIHAKYGDWTTMTHGFANLIYDHQGGARGDSKTFANSMLMVMGQRSLGAGDTLGVRAMVSADPFFGKGGYPLLLQSGETADGRTTLVDRQHPHDLFMELAATYSHRLSQQSSIFGYVGLPGEPALGPPAFMHRFSGEDNPEAPISHHWLDSTHIAFGVATLGYVFGNVKIEGSVFRGREPDQNRYDIEIGRLDSASLRLSYNPTPAWALQVSRGHIKSPEELHPDDDVDRTTASAIYHRDIGAAKWQTTLAWGRNASSHGGSTNAYLLESAVSIARTHTFFGRAERAGKNELFRRKARSPAGPSRSPRFPSAMSTTFSARVVSRPESGGSSAGIRCRASSIRPMAATRPPTCSSPGSRSSSHRKEMP
jgi:hypothetical protein